MATPMDIVYQRKKYVAMVNIDEKMIITNKLKKPKKRRTKQKIGGYGKGIQRIGRPI